MGHVQFESIHPFLDGNGRVGRLLVTLLLCLEGMLHEPLLYLSLYLKQHRDQYHDLLTLVRETGDWEAWIAFFAEGVRESAGGAGLTAQRLVERSRADRDLIQQLGRTARIAVSVHLALQEKPTAPPACLVERTGL